MELSQHQQRVFNSSSTASPSAVRALANNTQAEPTEGSSRCQKQAKPTLNLDWGPGGVSHKQQQLSWKLLQNPGLTQALHTFPDSSRVTPPCIHYTPTTVTTCLFFKRSDPSQLQFLPGMCFPTVHRAQLKWASSASCPVEWSPIPTVVIF